MNWSGFITIYSTNVLMALLPTVWVSKSKGILFSNISFRHEHQKGVGTTLSLVPVLQVSPYLTGTGGEG